MDGLDRSNYRRAYDELAGALSSRANYVRMEDFNEDEGSCGAARPLLRGHGIDGEFVPESSRRDAADDDATTWLLRPRHRRLQVSRRMGAAGHRLLPYRHVDHRRLRRLCFDGAKIFTTIYALIGITVILGALAPLAFLRGDWREKLLFGCGAKVDTNDPNLTMEEVNKLINYVLCTSRAR